MAGYSAMDDKNTKVHPYVYVNEHGRNIQRELPTFELEKCSSPPHLSIIFAIFSPFFF